STPRRFNIDCVIFHHGGSGNFYRRPYPLGERLASGFLDAGCAVMRVNNRGHDIVSRGTRGLQGFSLEIVDECRYDLAAWNDFAESRGFKNVALVGHSMGAVKSIYYMANVPDTRVRCVIAISPPRFSYSTYLSLEGRERFAADYARAQKFVAEG